MNKSKELMKLLNRILIITFTLFIFLILIDNFLEGFVANAFINQFMYDIKPVMTPYGPMGVEGKLNWRSLKSFIIFIGFFIIILMTIIVHFILLKENEKREKKVIEDIEKLLYQSIRENISAYDGKEKRYSEILKLMGEIKDKEELHRQLMEIEINRKNELITYLAHDLKTPLTSVIGYLNLLIDAPEIPTELKAKYMNITLDKAYKLENLINEFFEITRFNLQSIPLNKESIDLYYMMVQMTDEFYPLMKEKGIITELHLNEDMMVYGDSNKIARVFNNILKNAISYSYPNTVIHIYGSVKNHNIEIIFKNLGEKIPKEKLATIFEKFYRLDASRNSKTGGTGLGLAIAKEIIRQHEGMIKVESNHEYTSFFITLPQKEGSLNLESKSL